MPDDGSDREVDGGALEHRPLGRRKALYEDESLAVDDDGANLVEERGEGGGEGEGVLHIDTLRQLE